MTAVPDPDPFRVDEILALLHRLAVQQQHRDEKIVEARLFGATVPELAGSTGLSREHVHRILAKAKRMALLAAEEASQ